ncbi:MAG: hypothetical protein ACW981_13425 [Candidatus Hodarchaeales archaeon]|jgi:hypothetical protein
MILQSYGFKTFHHQGLTGFIRAGRQIPSRKVLNVLHQLRKKEKVIGFKKGPRWLWRLPNPEGFDVKGVIGGESGGQANNSEGVSAPNSETKETDSSGFSFSSDELDFSPRDSDEKKSSKKEESESEEIEVDTQNYSLAELTRSVSPSTGESDDDDDDDFEIIFADAEDDE